MTVKEIVEAWLKEHGYEGLFNRDGGCACALGDLVPCQAEGFEACEPGVKVPCGAGTSGEECCAYECCDGESAFHVVERAEEPVELCVEGGATVCATQAVAEHEELLRWVDVALRSALVWAGDRWGTPESVRWVVQGAVEAIQKRDEQAAELARIQNLPELEWAQVTATIMQLLSAVARGGAKEQAQTMLAALDRGKTYVARLQADRDWEAQEAKRLNQKLAEQHRLSVECPGHVAGPKCGRCRACLEEQVARLQNLPSVEHCRAERAAGNGGCGACALCCQELRDRAEAAEAENERLRNELANVSLASRDNTAPAHQILEAVGQCAHKALEESRKKVK